MELTDLENLSSNLGALLLEKKMYFTCAESCTGGLLSQSIVSVAGSSAWFGCSFITYSNYSKHKMLGVSKDSLKSYGAVSEEVAKQMAKGALNRSNATIAVSITGIAGPGGSEYKPEGLVCFAIAQKNSEVRVETIEYGPLGRSNIRSSAVEKAIELLHEELSVT